MASIRLRTHHESISPVVAEQAAERAAVTDRDVRSDMARYLEGRFFTRQADAIVDGESIDLTCMYPVLRGLLFTDGTVTRALEAQTLSPVSVEVVEQSVEAVPDDAARYLECMVGTPGLRRRVLITAGQSAVRVWGESFILSERLPRGFMNVLGDSPQGIGASIRRMGLESRRELLWYRVGESPGWDPLKDRRLSVLSRLYRIVIDDVSAMLVSEAFAIEQVGDRLRLRGGVEGSGPLAGDVT